MPLSVITGRNGRVIVEGTQVARITEWSVNPTLATSSEWGDSDSAGYTNRAAGRRDATADCEGKYDTENEVWDLFTPGDVAQLILDMDTSGNRRFVFPEALCTDFSLTVDIDSAEVIGWESSWGSIGFFDGPQQTDGLGRL